MKKFTKKTLNFTKTCLLFLGFMFSGNAILGQNIAVIGIDHTSGTSITNPSLTYTVLDGFSFVATQNLTAGSVYYFTNALYSSATSKFRVSSSAGDEGTRFVIQYTVPVGGVTKGTVVRLQETATSSSTFNITCSSGSCGTASTLAYNSQPINFAVGSSFPVSIYCYQDGDTDPLNGITTVHSVLFGGYQENGVRTFGTIPAAMDPTVNYATALVTDGLLSSLPTELTTIDFKPSLRSGAVSKITLERVGELRKAGSRVTFVVAKLQGDDQTVYQTDRLPVGSNIALSAPQTQTKT